MTIVVEDGTGLSNANAYVSVAAADTYFSDLNNASWTGSTAVKEAAIRKATKYLDATYNWIGTILSTTQALNWPRTGVTDSQGRDLEDQVPQAVVDACCELALLSFTDDLVNVTSNSDYIKREKVGELEVEYADGAPIDREYRYVDRLLAGLFNSKSGGSNTVKLARV